MKKLWKAMLLALSAFLLVSCGDDDVKCEDVGETFCPDLIMCANLNKQTAWFEYDGKKYKCKGSGDNINCDQAFQEVFSACGLTHCKYESSSTCDYQVCTDENGGRWYEYNGKKYECEGTWDDLDCDRATDELTNDCEGY